MKKHRWFSMIILLSVLVFFVVSSAEAVPPLPSSFYGSAKVNGSNIPEGAIIKAVIDGEEYALSIVEIVGGVSVYFLDVPGDEAATLAVIEGGTAGDTIQFYLGETPANQTGTWASGTNVALDLTFDVPTPPVMPSSFYGTVKINDENVPAGTVVKADINGVTYVTSIVSLYGGNTVYAINIPGDDPGTPAIEGGVHGDSIQFFIGDIAADQTGTWMSDTNTEINLTAIAPKVDYLYYLPLFSR